MTITMWVCLALGVVLTVFSIWQLAGRSDNARAWLTQSKGWRRVVNNVVTWPSLGLMLLALGTAGLTRDLDVVAIPMGIIGILAFIAFFVWGLLRFPMPLAFVPGWARDEARRRKENRDASE